MYPLKSILEFLLSGVSRVHVDEQADALCSMLAGLLPEMTPEDIESARHQIASRFWATPTICDQALALIDGHLILRSLLPDVDSDEGSAAASSDFEV